MASFVLFALVAQSGGGKTSILTEVVKRLSTRVAILRTITTAARRGPEDDANYRFLAPEEFAAVEARGDLIQKVDYKGRIYGNDRADVQGLVNRGLHGIAALTEEGVMNFRNKGYEVVMIRVIPVGPVKARRPEVVALDEARMRTGPAPDAVVVNDFNEPNGLSLAIADTAGIIKGYLIPRP